MNAPTGTSSTRRSGWRRRLDRVFSFGNPSLARIAPLTHAFARAARLGSPLSEACRDVSSERFPWVKSLLVLLHPGLFFWRRSTRRIARRLLLELSTGLETGLRTADVLDEFPDVFPPGYRALVRAGESCGRLPEAFEAADRWCQRDTQLRTDRRMRCIYPLAVLGILGVISWVILWKVFPTLTALAARAAGPAPLLTRALIRSLLLFERLGMPLIVVGAAAVLALALLASSTGPHRVMTDRLALAFGASRSSRALVERAIAFHTVAGALRSGIPLPEAFTSASSVFSNVVLGRRLTDMAEGLLRDGRVFAFAASPPLDPLFAAALTLAARTGSLPEAFDLLAERSFQRARQRDRTVAAVAEPVIILALGGCIAAAVLGTYAIILWLPTSVVP